LPNHNEKIETKSSFVTLQVPAKSTIKPEYDNHLWDPKIVTVVYRWHCLEVIYLAKVQKVQNGGLYRQVVAIQRWAAVLTIFNLV